MEENTVSLKKIVELSHINDISSLPSKKVLVGGCFDILHFGHISFLVNAKKKGDLLVILLESDEYIKKSKRREPFHSQDERAMILSHLDVVDVVVKLPLLTENSEYFELVKKIKPFIIAVTDGDSKVELKQEQACKLDAKVEVVISQLPFSSSKYASFFRD